MKMKKTLLFITMACTLLFAQCKKEKDSVSAASRTVGMTITVGPGGKTDITGTGGIKWSESDIIYVGDGSKYIGYLTLMGGEGTPTGTFTGSVELTDISEGDNQTFHFYYLGSTDHTNLAKDATSVEVDFSSQNITKGEDGNLTNASAYHVGYGSTKGTITDGMVMGINVTMVSKVAIARFSFTKDNSKEAYTGALKLSGANIYSTMIVNFNSTGFDCEGTNGEINLTNTTSSEKYVMLVPTSSTTTPQLLTFAGSSVMGGAILENGIRPNQFYGMNEAIAVTAHETVNMGLPSPYDKLEWAVYNIGATNGTTVESWCGDHYAWGETEPYYQNGAWCAHPSHDSSITFDASVGYKWNNYLDGISTSWNASLDWKPYGDGTTLTSEYDAATATWGSGWRMPTTEEWKALYDNTTSVWTDNYNSTGVKGRIFTNKNDTSKTLFLPATGYRDGTNLNTVNFLGYYWSSSLDLSNISYAYNMYFSAGHMYPQHTIFRYGGFTVRPVYAAW